MARGTKPYEFTEEQIKAVMGRCRTRTALAAALGCSRDTAYRYMRKYGLVKARPKVKAIKQRKPVTTTCVRQLVHTAVQESGSLELEDVMYALGEIAPAKVQYTLKVSDVAEALKAVIARIRAARKKGIYQDYLSMEEI
jgi:hypothetical protein